MEYKIVVKNDDGEYIHESEFMDSERAQSFVRCYEVLNIVTRPTKHALDVAICEDCNKNPALEGCSVCAECGL